MSSLTPSIVGGRGSRSRQVSVRATWNAATLLLSAIGNLAVPDTAAGAQAQSTGSVRVEGRVVAGVPPSPTFIGSYVLDAPPNVSIRQLSASIVEVTGVVSGTSVTAHLAPLVIDYGVASPAPPVNFLMAAVSAWGTPDEPLRVFETNSIDTEDPNFPNLHGSMATAIYEQSYARSTTGTIHGIYVLHVSPGGQAMCIDVYTEGEMRTSGQDGPLTASFLQLLVSHLRSP